MTKLTIAEKIAYT